VGFLSRLLRSIRAQLTFRLTDGDQVARVFGDASTSAGKIVSETGALRISTAWACMRIISETIGSLPWHLYRREGEGDAQRVDDHELAALLVSPNADQTSTEFREAKTLNLCQSGNAYSWIERAGERIVALVPLRSREVQPMRKLGSNTSLRITEGGIFYRINDRGQPEDVPRERIWHVKGFGNDGGLVGLSPIGAAREAMGAALAAEEFGNRFFSQGGVPAGTVSVPGWLTKEQREVARESLQRLMGGLGNAHKFAMFEGGMKPEAWGQVNFEDLQFILLRKFSVLEICRFYRVPPHMVADLDRATFSNIEHLSQEFVMFTLMPYLTRFEASVAKWLLRPRDRGRYFLRFNFEGLLRADSAGRAAFYASALQNGYMNRNEVRALENLNRVDGLDKFTAQTNLVPVEDLGKAAAQQPGALHVLGGTDAERIAASLQTAMGTVSEALLKWEEGRAQNQARIDRLLEETRLH
jgi:HK97 family phage portal protein